MQDKTKDLRATRERSGNIPLWQVFVTSGVALLAVVALIVFLYGFWKHVR